MLRAFEMIFWSKNELKPMGHSFMDTFTRNTRDGNISIGGKDLRKE